MVGRRGVRCGGEDGLRLCCEVLAEEDGEGLGEVAAYGAAVVDEHLLEERLVEHRDRPRTSRPNAPDAAASGDVLDRVWNTVRLLGDPLRTLPEPPTITGIVVNPSRRRSPPATIPTASTAPCRPSTPD